MLKEDRKTALKLGAFFLEENIFYIPNFIPIDLLKKIKIEIDAEKDWTYAEFGNEYENLFKVKNLKLIEEIHSFYDKLSQIPTLLEAKKDPCYERHDVIWIKRRGSLHGAVPSMAAHWDGDPSPKYVGFGGGSMQVPNRVKWASVIYLNDDFEGGELNYEELGIKYKPTAGSLIFHKGDDPLYRHSVDPIVGMRYNLILNYMYGDINQPEPGEKIHNFS